MPRRRIVVAAPKRKPTPRAKDRFASLHHFGRLARLADAGRTISVTGMTDDEILALLSSNGRPTRLVSRPV